jgi:hypothetical protein
MLFPSESNPGKTGKLLQEDLFVFLEDLSPCMYVASSLAEGERLKAVGWLAYGHPYTSRQLPSPETRLGQLLRLLVDPWQPVYFMGSHECEFCPEETVQASPVGNEGSEEPLVTRQVVDGAEIEFVEWQTPRLKAYYRRHQIERDGLVVHFGATNLYVPADGCVYVAPSMIAHYVDMHRYEPPAVFWEAVTNCPDMASQTYKQALISNGPSNEHWVRAVRAV